MDILIHMLKQVCERKGQHPRIQLAMESERQIKLDVNHMT
jgi:hypothetical protein